MAKEVDPKSGKEKPPPEPEDGLLSKLTKSVDALLDRVTKVEETTAKTEVRQKKGYNLLEKLFGEEPEETPPAA